MLFEKNLDQRRCGSAWKRIGTFWYAGDVAAKVKPAREFRGAVEVIGGAECIERVAR